MSPKRMPRNSWPKEFGFETMKADCAVHGYKLGNRFATLGQWKLAVRDQNTRIDVTCAHCGHTTAVKLDNFHRRKRAACFCSNAVRWHSAEGHQRMLSIIAQSRFEPMPEILTLKGWMAVYRDNRSYLPIRCTRCGIVSTNCWINTFALNRTADCGCKNRTQQLVEDHVRSLCDQFVPKIRVEREVACGNRQHYDMCVYMQDRCILAIEVDGAQHFRKKTAFRVDFDAVQQRDLSKELNCLERGIPMLRLYQESVWKEQFDWRSAVHVAISRAADQSLPVCIFRQEHDVYKQGSYASIRHGTRAEVVTS